MTGLTASCVYEVSASFGLALIGGLIGLVAMYRVRTDKEKALDRGLMLMIYIECTNIADALYRLFVGSACRPAGYPTPGFSLVMSVIFLAAAGLFLFIRMRDSRNPAGIDGIEGGIRFVCRSEQVMAITVSNGNEGFHIILDPAAAARWNAAIDSVLADAETAEFSRGKACVTFTRTDDSIVIQAYNADAPHLWTMAEFTDRQAREIQKQVKNIIRPIAA